MCGPYGDAAITMSNGFNTYDETNCWGHPGCGYSITAPPESGTSAAPWSVTAQEPLGNTAVESYPTEMQLTNNWCGTGWGGCGADTPLAALTQLSSSYSESMPHGGGMDAQFAWDIWTSNNSGYPGEIMVWTDNAGRGGGGATFHETVTVAGQSWDVYTYGSGELILSLDGPGGQGTFAQQGAGTVDLLALLNRMVADGYTAAGASIGQIDVGWEICSTGGLPQTFTMNSYSITAG